MSYSNVCDAFEAPQGTVGVRVTPKDSRDQSLLGCKLNLSTAGKPNATGDAENARLWRLPLHSMDSRMPLLTPQSAAQESASQCKQFKPEI